MGDRHDRDRARRMKRYGGTLPPEPILTWGIGDVALNGTNAGHNGGPPLDEEPGYLWRKYRWTKAYKEAWKTPSMAVLKFRVARAEAAGVTYEQYMLELLDSGRHLQKGDVERKAKAEQQAAATRRPRAAAKPQPLGGAGPISRDASQPPAETKSAPAKPARPVPKPLGG
jgi:hypothetical protein